MRRKLSRRMFLRSATGGVVALPLLCDFDRKGQAQANAAKRLVVIFTPNGQVTSAWRAQGAGAEFQLGEVTAAALGPHKSDVVVAQNLDMTCALDGPGGDAHALGIGCMLTGTELLAGNQFLAGMGGLGSGWPGGISVDQFIASKIGTTTRFRSLEFSMKRAAGTIWTRMSYLGPGMPVTPNDDPSVAFERMFGDVALEPAARARRKAKRASVLDGVTSEFSALGASLSGSDRRKVEAHLAAIRNIENQLNNLASSATCALPRRPTLSSGAEVYRNPSGMEVPDPKAHADVPERQAVWRELMVAALACDLTRVSSFIMAPSRSDIFLDWLGLGPLAGEPLGARHSHHDYSHMDNTAGTPSGNALIQINQWYAAQIANIVADMKRIPEGSGTLFDNSVLLWCNELGEGGAHTHTNIPLLTIGSAGGAIRTGQALDMPLGTSHNRLLISLINAIGVTDTTGFGNPLHNAGGPLPGFVA